MLSVEEYELVAELAARHRRSVSSEVRHLLQRVLLQKESKEPKKAKGQGVPPRLASLTKTLPTRTETNG